MAADREEPAAATPSVQAIRERVDAAEADGWYGYDAEARADVRFLLDENEKLREALRAAPMPFRESTLKFAWDDAYDEWWHTNASEDALGGDLS